MVPERKSTRRISVLLGLWWLALTPGAVRGEGHGPSDSAGRPTRKLFIYRGSASSWATSVEGAVASNYLCACFGVDDPMPKCVLSTPTQTEAVESKDCDEKKCTELFGRGFFSNPTSCATPSRVYFPGGKGRMLSEGEVQKLDQRPSPAPAPTSAVSSPNVTKPFVPTSPFPVLDPKVTPFPF